MDRKKFAKDLEKRTRRFAVKIIRLSLSLPDTPEGRVVRNQITKAGTSVGVEAFSRFIQLLEDFLAQIRGADDEGGPNEREQQHILDRGNAALVVPEPREILF